MNRLVVAVILLAAPSYGLVVYAGDTGASPHVIERIAAVAPGPGRVSWSPDGSMLAIAGKNLQVYDTGTKLLRTSGISNPRFVHWSEDGRLLVIVWDLQVGALVAVDPVSLAPTTLIGGIDADAAFPCKGDVGKMILLSTRTNALSFGLNVAAEVSVHDIGTSSEKKLYGFGRIIPTRVAHRMSTDLYSSWMYAGPNPLDGSIMAMEHIKPPVVAPYARVSVVDPETAKGMEVAGSEMGRVYRAGSWSPDGTRVALSDIAGRLAIFDLVQPGPPVEIPVIGAFPSWNPSGSQIYIGGYVVNSDGNGKVAVFASDPLSIGVWSPDGTRLAVVSERDLYLVGGIRPSFTKPDAPPDDVKAKKVLILRELAREGLISEKEYKAERMRMFREGGGPE